MTIDKAIEILVEYRKQFHPDTDFDYAQAVSLSIEALNAWKQFREGTWRSGTDDLPGETEG